MDLFTLLAKLTLDSKDYEKALKNAEKDGKKAKLDAKGTLTATDHYTQGLNQAQNAARNFHGNATGTISAVDHYSGAIDAATRKGEQFDPNAKDDIDAGTDHYSAALDAATQKASEFAPDASDDIDVGTDHYAAAMEADETAAGDFEPGAEGSIGLTEDQFSTAMSDDETAASTFSPEPSGDIALGDDAFAAAMSADETSASTFDPDADGSIGLTDDEFADALADDISDAATAVLDASGTITGDDDYSDDADSAQATHDLLSLDAHGNITADTSDFTDAVGEASEASGSFGTSFGDMVDGLERKLKAAGIIAAIGGITTAFRNAIHTSANYADTVDKTSKALQMSTHDYQVWEYVLGQSGATMDLVSRGWDKMDEVAAGIDWSGMTDAMGNAFDPANFDNPADLFNGMMEALAGLEDKSRRADILEALFGPRGRQFNAFLDDGLEGLAQLRQEAEDLGLIMTDEDIANGVAFGDAIGRMDAALGGLRNKITGEIIPYLTQAVDLITDLLTGKADPAKVAEGMASLVQQGLQALNDAIPKIVTVLSDMFSNPAFVTSLLQLVHTIVEGLGKLAAAAAAGATIKTAKDMEPIIDEMFGEGTFQRSVAPVLDPYGNMGLYNRNGEGVEDEYNPAGSIVGNYGTGEQPGAEPGNIWPSMSKTGWDTKGLPGWGYWNYTYPANNGSSYGETFAMFADAVYDKVSNLYGDVSLQEFQSLLRVIGESYEGGYAAISRLSGADLTALVNRINIVRDDAGLYAGTTIGSITAPRVDITTTGTTLFADSVIMPGDGTDGSHAKGLWSVPYDDYTARLHRDEMVLTASQAREYRDGGGENAAIVGAIQELRNDMANLRIFVGERAFGQTVVDYSGRRLHGYLGRTENRQFAGYGWG